MYSRLSWPCGLYFCTYKCGGLAFASHPSTSMIVVSTTQNVPTCSMYVEYGGESMFLVNSILYDVIHSRTLSVHHVHSVRRPVLSLRLSAARWSCAAWYWLDCLFDHSPFISMVIFSICVSCDILGMSSPPTDAGRCSNLYGNPCIFLVMCSRAGYIILSYWANSFLVSALDLAWYIVDG